MAHKIGVAIKNIEVTNPIKVTFFLETFSSLTKNISKIIIGFFYLIL